MKQNKLGIFLYNRLFDPLIQSNFWLYINDYLEHNNNGDYKLCLITYEDPRFPLTEVQLQQVKEWESKGLVWTKLRWNPGTGIPSKVRDILQGFFAVTGTPSNCVAFG